MKRPLVVLFARHPRLGRVKTRLGRDIGLLAAYRFYRDTLFSLSRRLGRDGRWRLVLAVTPDISCSYGRVWPPGLTRYRQGGGDLGQRMQRRLSLAGSVPVVILGTDTPDIHSRHIALALKLLGRNDVVFGPAEDGGYWLVGVRQKPVVTGLFQDVRWSTPHALSDTLANVGPRFRAARLDTLCDIDDGPSYRAWRDKHRSLCS